MKNNLRFLTLLLSLIILINLACNLTSKNFVPSQDAESVLDSELSDQSSPIIEPHTQDSSLWLDEVADSLLDFPGTQIITLENADRVNELTRQGNGNNYDLAWSPDGKLLVVATSIGIYFYESQGLEELSFIPTDDPVYNVALSPDGLTLASWSGDNHIRLWDVESKNELLVIKGERVTFLFFSIDGRKLITVEGSVVNTLDISNGNVNLSFELDIDCKAVHNANFSFDRNILALGCYFDRYDFPVYLIDLDTGSVNHKLSGHKDTVIALAFSPDGSILSSGDLDGIIRLWDSSSGGELSNIGASKNLTNVIFTQDGSKLIIIDAMIRIWDITGSTEMISMEVPYSRMKRSAVLSPSGTKLALANYEGTICLWDVEAGLKLACKAGFQAGEVAFSPDGRILAVEKSNIETMVCLLDVDTLTEIRCLNEAYGKLAFSPDSRTLVIASSTGLLFWDLETEQIEKSYIDLDIDIFSTIYSVDFSPDGHLLALGCSDNSIRLWDVENRKESSRFLGHTETVTSVAFSPRGEILASGSEDGTIRIWDIINSINHEILVNLKYPIETVSFSPDGHIIAGGNSLGLFLWNLDLNLEIIIKAKNLKNVYSVTFGSDPNIVALSTINNNVQILDFNKGVHLNLLTGHTGRVNSVVFSPDGRILASSSQDSTVRLWGIP